MKAGFDEADITPSFGSEIPGDYYKCFVQQVHDSLQVRAAVFGEGDDRVALRRSARCQAAALSTPSTRRSERSQCDG